MTAAVVDQMLVLGTSPEGRHAVTDLPCLVAGAAFADLALAGRLACPGRTVRVEDETPTGHPVLDEVLANVATVRVPRTPWRWVFDCARPVLGAERRRLVDEGVLGAEEDTVLGMLPRVRHPLLDVPLRDEILERVRTVVLADDVTAARDEARPDTRMLLSLLGTTHHPRRTAAALVPELDARRLRARLGDASTPHWVTTGTARAITLANAARAGAH
ncbi:GOLPH3/VPS74 family protein [Mobilicoccus pelagius]|uniref:GPP34 family phosphoprotein n=1 Tax=Mobilicoccus pelagius NBRC 104925 TaxID=1089455 RepID=H5UUY6_9MICO|nr:GPP34 family phosphoprotein [Mobilicoccus pelagius]GAB49544.1 hypothetical protein MOPEL_130_01510 [Mobilicoccus pelagius NBRC 104925]